MKFFKLIFNTLLIFAVTVKGTRLGFVAQSEVSIPFPQVEINNPLSGHFGVDVQAGGSSNSRGSADVSFSSRSSKSDGDEIKANAEAAGRNFVNSIRSSISEGVSGIFSAIGTAFGAKSKDKAAGVEISLTSASNRNLNNRGNGNANLELTFNDRSDPARASRVGAYSNSNVRTDSNVQLNFNNRRSNPSAVGVNFNGNVNPYTNRANSNRNVEVNFSNRNDHSRVSANQNHNFRGYGNGQANLEVNFNNRNAPSVVSANHNSNFRTAPRKNTQTITQVSFNSRNDRNRVNTNGYNQPQNVNANAQLNFGGRKDISRVNTNSNSGFQTKTVTSGGGSAFELNLGHAHQGNVNLQTTTQKKKPVSVTNLEIELNFNKRKHPARLNVNSESSFSSQSVSNSGFNNRNDPNRGNLNVQLSNTKDINENSREATLNSFGVINWEDEVGQSYTKSTIDVLKKPTNYDTEVASSSSNGGQGFSHRSHTVASSSMTNNAEPLTLSGRAAVSTRGRHSTNIGESSGSVTAGNTGETRMSGVTIKSQSTSKAIDRGVGFRAGGRSNTRVESSGKVKSSSSRNAGGYGALDVSEESNFNSHTFGSDLKISSGREKVDIKDSRELLGDIFVGHSGKAKASQGFKTSASITRHEEPKVLESKTRANVNTRITTDTAESISIARGGRFSDDGSEKDSRELHGDISVGLSGRSGATAGFQADGSIKNGLKNTGGKSGSNFKFSSETITITEEGRSRGDRNEKDSKPFTYRTSDIFAGVSSKAKTSTSFKQNKEFSAGSLSSTANSDHSHGQNGNSQGTKHVCKNDDIEDRSQTSRTASANTDFGLNDDIPVIPDAKFRTSADSVLRIREEENSDGEVLPFGVPVDESGFAVGVGSNSAGKARFSYRRLQRERDRARQALYG